MRNPTCVTAAALPTPFRGDWFTMFSERYGHWPACRWGFEITPTPPPAYRRAA